MRKPHYWKRAKATATPSNMIVFDTETIYGEAARVEGGEFQTLRLGWAYAFRLEKGKPTRERWYSFKSADAFWELVRSRLDKRRPLWVWAHNIAFDLGVVDAWERLQADKVPFDKVCLGSNFFWLRGTIDGCTVVFCDTFNFLKTSLARIGTSLGIPKLKMPAIDDSEEDWSRYCRNDVEVTAAALLRLISFVRDNDLGPWQVSAAGLAFSAFRHRFMHDKVLVHNYRKVLSLERSAYYGGIVDTRFVGKVPASPVHELDVCSLYPWCCTKPLPYKFLSAHSNVSVDTLKKWGEKFHVIADVTIRTQDHVFPTRVGKLVFYPTGEYRTCLAWPELAVALANGCVCRVHLAARYAVREIFSEYQLFFTQLKASERAKQDRVYRDFAKLCANSLYGKTGQRTPIWREWGIEALADIADSHGLPQSAVAELAVQEPRLMSHEEIVNIPRHGLQLQCRCYFGAVEVRVGFRESRDSCPAIAATVVSYGHVRLRELQALAGDGNWFYSDTDSLWVNDAGLANLQAAGEVADDTLGKLKLERTYSSLEVFGPKDYVADDKVRRKGIRVNASLTPDGGWEQQQFPSGLAQIRAGTTNGVFVRDVVKHLHRRITKSKRLPTGFTVPLVFPAEIPERLPQRRTD